LPRGIALLGMFRKRGKMGKPYIGKSKLTGYGWMSILAPDASSGHHCSDHAQFIQIAITA
jgi:hypothetical protein